MGKGRRKGREDGRRPAFARARSPPRSTPPLPPSPQKHTQHQTGLLPLDVGTLVDCKWRDGEYYTARVIERRVAAEFASGRGGGGGDAMETEAAGGSGPGAAAAAAAAKKAAAAAPLDPSIPPTGYEYYVHYLKFNRRMDEWVGVDSMDLATVDTADVKGVGGGGGGPGGAAARKRAAGAGGDDHADEDHAEFDAHALREHEEFTKVKNVERIELGRYEMETWYFSPLPPEAAAAKKLYFAEFDLAFFTRRDAMLDHLRKCRLQHPPGDEIYRKGPVSMFEVDGKKEKVSD
jgi:histone acetyltransferase MYST1